VKENIANDHSPHPWQIGDEFLWESFRNGNWDALESIYRTYTKDLFNYGMKICANTELVEDNIQELFVELWNNRKNLNPTSKIKFYLFRALKWKIVRQLKRENKFFSKRKPEEGEVIIQVQPFESHLLHEQAANERKAQLAEAMKKLPQRQKEIVHLLFFEELTYQEIAEIMNIRVRSVYVTAARALASLRKTIKPWSTFLILQNFLWM